MSTDDTDDPTPAVGMVLDEGRGSLPYQLIHGESLVACAAWALGDAGVDLADDTVAWQVVVDSARDVVLHDSLCPMAPPEFIAACLAKSRLLGRPVVGVRPVTDTVKVVAGGLVQDTLDRESLLAVASPLVIPAAVVAHLARRPRPDLAAVVAELVAAGHHVEALDAPPEARRVGSAQDVALLAALTHPRG